ncbi:hypothetical protein QE152_g1186 [Popillia japonica]|uniref:Uncharacterized protein n=1 Tax=Popillia japonica TaxID=7064 RepID=A0AAW1N338_POPJA
MRDRDRDLWSVGPGTFLSHSERPLPGLDCLSIQRLDALLYTEGNKWRSQGRIQFIVLDNNVEICALKDNVEVEGENKEDEVDNEEMIVKPSRNDILEALQTLQKFAQTSGEVHVHFEDNLYKVRRECLKNSYLSAHLDQTFPLVGDENALFRFISNDTQAITISKLPRSNSAQPKVSLKSEKKNHSSKPPKSDLSQFKTSFQEYQKFG